MSTRRERAAEALRLRGEGLSYAEIGLRLGVRRSYANALVLDPDGTRDHARKMQAQGGTCVDCGAATSYGKNGTPSQRCSPCSRIASRHWTHDRVVEAIQEFTRRYGRQPGAMDWNTAMARTHGRTDLAERFFADGCWPTYGSVTHRFGRWNAAIAAAGFEPMPTGHRPGDYAWTPELISAAIADWAVAHGGQTPTVLEWEAAGGPSMTTVVDRFGSWRAAVVAAGLEPRRAGRPRSAAA